MTDPEYKLTRTYINHTDNTQVTVEVTTPNRNPDELKQKVDKKASSILNYNTVGDLFSDWDGKGVHYGWGNAPWGENELLNDLEAIFNQRENPAVNGGRGCHRWYSTSTNPPNPRRHVTTHSHP